MYYIKKAASIIKNSDLVAFPTETVYGLGADAYSQEACLKIFEAKGRPANNPLIVHVASVQEAKDIVHFNDDAENLASLWPGPLTLVLPKKDNAILAECVTAGLNTVAIRIPADPIALNLIRESGCPIAAPSANKSGTLSSTSYEHVRKNFGDEIFILGSNGNATYGLESTIIDLTSPKPTILRFGFITPSVLEKVLGREVFIASKLSEIKAPGMLLKHYAPKTKIRLNADVLRNSEVGLNFGKSQLNAGGSMNLSDSKDMIEAAANLFDYLHNLDEFCQKNNINTIAVASIPNTCKISTRLFEVVLVASTP
jgi:L-threonylcarbamoyladenylate synthase